MHSEHSHHEHDHGSHRPSSSGRLIGVLLLCVSYMVAEIFGGYWSGSLALFADAGHMAIDSAAMALGLFAIWMANRPPTPEKTYGYYRAEILAALFNGATLVCISFWIFYEAWHRFQSPQPVRGELMGVIAVGGLVVNLFALFLMKDRHHSNLNIRGIWLHLIGDTLGSVSAVAAAFVVWKFGWTWADPLMSVAITILILFGACKLVLECVNVLLEGVPKGADVIQIRKHIEGVNGVKDVHDLHVWAVSNGVAALSAHIRLKDPAELDHTAVLQEITSLLRQLHHIEHVTLQLEPPSFSHSGDLLDCQKVQKS